MGWLYGVGFMGLVGDWSCDLGGANHRSRRLCYGSSGFRVVQLNNVVQTVSLQIIIGAVREPLLRLPSDTQTIDIQIKILTF